MFMTLNAKFCEIEKADFPTGNAFFLMKIIEIGDIID